MGRRPLLAMMLIVKSLKNAGTTAWDPKISTKDHLFKEVNGERKEALKICKNIMQELHLTWDGIQKEMDRLPSGGRWNLRGDTIHLDFLCDKERGDL